MLSHLTQGVLSNSSRNTITSTGQILEISQLTSVINSSTISPDVKQVPGMLRHFNKNSTRLSITLKRQRLTFSP